MGAMGHDPHRRRLEDRSDPGHLDAFEGESDYLTVMNLLFRSISQVLADQCALTTLQYRMLLRLLGARAAHHRPGREPPRLREHHIGCGAPAGGGAPGGARRGSG